MDTNTQDMLSLGSAHDEQAEKKQWETPELRFLEIEDTETGALPLPETIDSQLPS